MTVKRLSNIKIQYDDSNGVLASNYRLFFYAAGSSTKQNTYNSSAGNVANSNPIVLNALGEPAVEIWLTAGQSYKVGLAVAGTDDPPAAFVWTEDNIVGVNDASLTADQWLELGLAVTYLSASSFTVPGDQTTVLHAGRRVKVVDAGGTKYGTIFSSAFSSLTTVVVTLDSGTFSDPITSLRYGILSAANYSVPSYIDRLANDATPDGAADYLMTYDASAGIAKKVLLNLATKFKVGVTSRALDAASGSQAVTGVGFKPKALLIFVTCGTINDHASIGFSDGTTSGALLRSVSLFLLSASPTLAWITNGTYAQTADLTSLDSDGFTLAWTKTGSPSSATMSIAYLALR